MKQTRIIIGAFVASSLAVGIACSFPDVSFVSDGIVEAGADTFQPPEDAANPGALALSDGAIPDDVDPNGADSGSVTLDDAAVMPVDASCDSCDCDGDEYDRDDLSLGGQCDGGGKKPG